MAPRTAPSRLSLPALASKTLLAGPWNGLLHRQQQLEKRWYGHDGIGGLLLAPTGIPWPSGSFHSSFASHSS